MRRRPTPPPVLELRIESLVVDASWARRSRDVLEAGLRAGLERELLDLLGRDASPPGAASGSAGPGRPRLADEVTLSCPGAPGPDATGHMAGRTIGSDLGARLWPAARSARATREERP